MQTVTGRTEVNILRLQMNIACINPRAYRSKIVYVGR